MPHSSDQLLNGCRSSLTDQDSSYAIQSLNRREASLVFEWATQHSWDPGIFDPGCFYASDSHGFFAVTKDKEITGAIAALACDEQRGMMGLCYVKEAYRDTSVRSILEQAARAYLGDRSIALACIPEDVARYRAYGFEPVFMSTRYQGTIPSLCIHQPSTTPLAEIPFRWIEHYDAQITGSERSKFLSLWINQPKGFAVGVLKNNRLCGYGVARLSRKGYRIGPLCADTDEIATTILSELCADLPSGTPFFVDCGTHHEAARSLVEQFSMTQGGSIVHMTTGHPDDLPDSRLYGLTSGELGNR